MIKNNIERLLNKLMPNRKEYDYEWLSGTYTLLFFIGLAIYLFGPIFLLTIMPTLLFSLFFLFLAFVLAGKYL
jgi:hypothetical protein